VDLDQLRRTAIHEAGHAIVGYLKLRGERKLLKVSIIPEEDTVGQVLWSGWPE
jgi:ATP-dependent Zn protease